MAMTTLHTTADIPEGWAVLELDTLPAEFTSGEFSICTNMEAREGFAANLVLQSSSQIPDDPHTWFIAATEGIGTNIPGIVFIDSQQWMSEDYAGLMTCGTYVHESTSVTMMQWACIGDHSSFFLTGTCATSEFNDMQLVFNRVAASCQEIS